VPVHPTVAILHTLPEALVVIGLVYGLLGFRFQLGRIAVLGLLFLTTTLTVRALGAPFPAHALFSLIIMSVVISLWSRLALQRVICAWAAALALLITVEVCSMLLIQHLTGISIEELLAQPVLWAISGWPHIIVLGLAAVWAFRRGGLKPFKEAAG